MRKGKARDYKRWRIAPLDLFDLWEDSRNHEFAPTLREAREIRTQIAKGIGLPSFEIGIYDNVTQKRKE